jgi:hypothetical protein
VNGLLRGPAPLIAALVVVGLTGPSLTWAADALQRDAPAASDPAGARAKVPRHPQRLTAAQVIEERVRRLTRVLDLNETQQARLAELLESERREIRRVWTENPRPQADRTGPTLAIIDRTRNEIRAMLNDEQKKKYPAAVPRDSLAPANADTEYWLRLIQSVPRQDAGGPD